MMFKKPTPLKKPILWDEFCELTPGERKWLSENCFTKEQMTENLLALAGRPNRRFENTETALYEEAGKFADIYNGQGWLYLRGLLVSFHQHMLKLEAGK